jgi:N-acetylmuramoyl-L-alanine amidase
MYNRHRLLYIGLLFCTALTFFSFRPAGSKDEKKKWVVVIDAGHGGKDPGCHGKHFKEKDVALAVSLKFGHLLEENNKDITVIYTRKTDVFVALNERAEIANRNHADFFICIHCNASPSQEPKGSATYVMGLSKSEGNLEISKRENSSVLYEKDYKQTYNGFDPNSDEAAILFAMYQNIYLAQSLDLSAKIEHEYTGLVKTTDNGVKQAGFLVLWKTAMPSLLTEIGFLTNPEEERVLGSQKGEDEIANSIFLAFEQYKAEKDGTTYDASAFNMSPLVVANMPDTVAADTAKTISVTPGKNKEEQKTKEEDTSSSKEVLAPVKKAPKENKPQVHDTTAKKEVVNQPKETPKEPKPLVKQDSIKAKKMQEAIKSMHTDTVATANKFVPAHDTASSQNDSTRIVYKVQFAVSPKPLQINDAKYTGLPNIEMYQDNTNYKYTAGHYYDLKDAADLQNKMRTNGYKDAFVITFKGNKRVTLTKLSSK